jgi:hypothetical protein
VCASGCDVRAGSCNVSRSKGVCRNVCHGQKERNNHKLMYWTYLW